LYDGFPADQSLEKAKGRIIASGTVRGLLRFSKALVILLLLNF